MCLFALTDRMRCSRGGGSNVLVTELKQIVMLGLVIIFKFLKIYSGVEISVISFVQWYQKIQ